MISFSLLLVLVYYTIYIIIIIIVIIIIIIITIIVSLSLALLINKRLEWMVWKAFVGVYTSISYQFCERSRGEHFWDKHVELNRAG